MGKGKLAKFADMHAFPHVFEPEISFKDIIQYEKKGCWDSSFFHNGNPIILELGCGRGEYTVGLARMYPNFNFIGVDIKGARMWTGADVSLKEGLTNVAFLRTEIELIDRCFGQGEVSGIWLTFPDPQMKKVTKRLTSTRFLERYRRILVPEGTISLKTDSNFLFTYTSLLIEKNGLECERLIENLYSKDDIDPELSIQTYYERQWRERGKKIKFIRFILPAEGMLKEPDVEIEMDDYRSFGRYGRSGLTTTK